MAAHEGGSPHLILYQLINVGILVVGMIYLMKDKATIFFRERREKYLESSRRTEDLLQSVQKQKNRLEAQISEIERDEKNVFARAESEAKRHVHDILEAAENQKHRLEKEYGEFTAREVAKARADLKQGIIESVFEMTHATPSTSPKKEFQA